MIGVLLVNLGTPDAPDRASVRRYLKEFLSDPKVIDLPGPFRWLLVHGIIGPIRSPKSARAYQKIWRPEGSPLLFNSVSLAKAVQSKLGEGFKVALGMRYGNPSITMALEDLARQGVDQIRVLPLYPQYAASSVGTVENVVLKWNRSKKDGPEIRFIPPFFDHPGFLQSFAQIGGPLLHELKPDHVLFSFHGLPVRHILKEDVSGNHCLKSEDCCEKMVPANGMCYRAHCFQSARGIARLLNLAPSRYTICFQSRLGKGWLEPFTDVLFQTLPEAGVRKLLVFCPSFVADCLETLEEIQIRGKELFLQHGGREFLMVPSLNAHPAWVEAVTQMAKGSDNRSLPS